MKVVALVSGGKDSCYNMMQCVANGHEIVALANLKPPSQSGKDELDSFMYQTVGHDAIHLYSECMDLPLYRREIIGESVLQGSDYVVTANDETEDLYVLLKEVLKNHPDIQGVSVGAILSNYQRVRVEHVCNRLGLTSFAYLWRREQKELLFEMANAGVNAILIKIAAIGLKPIHLGKSIGQMYPFLCQMNELYDLHICGEGGEYETFTVDCPLFKKRIVIEETETVIHSDDAFAQVAYLKFKKCSLEEKTQDEMDISQVVIQDWKKCDSYDKITFAVNEHKESSIIQPEIPHIIPSTLQKHLENPYVTDLNRHAPFYAIDGTTAFDNNTTKRFETIEDETLACMLAVREKLHKLDLDWKDVVTVNVFVTDMNDFGQINAIYKKFFNINPAPRALVGANLKGPSRLQIDLVAIKALDHVKRDTMHVQGISYWAPANIGPYSQSVVTQGHAFIAGQIGLVPNKLDLPSPKSFAEEAALSLRNLENIVSVLDLDLRKDTAVCCCYVSDPSYLPLAQVAWKAYIDEDEQIPPTLYIAVPSLPRGAMVEWQVILNAPLPIPIDDDDDTTDEDEETVKKLALLKVKEGPFDIISVPEAYSRALSKNNLTIIVVQSSDTTADLNVTISHIVESISESLSQCRKNWEQILSLRVFYCDKLDVTNQVCTNMLQSEILKQTESIPVITCIPVDALGPNGSSLMACTLHIL
ncbi:MAG: ATP binding domain 4-like protein [Benjaminiella poitrasii]|nr:MAG: ATP binding domain 4-like protein [Benjaminiella poitrasii]